LSNILIRLLYGTERSGYNRNVADGYKVLGSRRVATLH
jgi:hypothetical protein